MEEVPQGSEGVDDTGVDRNGRRTGSRGKVLLDNLGRKSRVGTTEEEVFREELMGVGTRNRTWGW